MARVLRRVSPDRRVSNPIFMSPGERQHVGMDQRVSLITLGVADTTKARRFYEALGWAGQSSDDDGVFFQAGGMVFAPGEGTSWARTAA